MEKFWWALGILFSFSYANAAVDWDRVSASKIPSVTVVTITNSVSFQPGSDYANLGSIDTGGFNDPKDMIFCGLNLQTPYENGILLKGPIILDSISVKSGATDGWGTIGYVFSGHSNKSAVDGIFCTVGNRLMGLFSVGDFVKIINQVGSVKLPTPDNQ